MSDVSFSIDLSVKENGRKSPNYTLDTDLAGEITLDELLNFTKSSLIIIADETLREEQVKGFDKNPVVAVDGRVGKPVINVNPLGKIEFNSRTNIDDMLLATYEGILHRSKVVTGLYKSSHYVFLNGRQVATDMSSLKAWLSTKPDIKDSDLIRFVNIQPYARRLERFGVTAQRSNIRLEKSRDKRQRSGPKILAPNGAYFLTARSIKRLYKRNSSIRFGFIPGYLLGLSATFKTFSRASGSRRESRSKKSTYLYPTITISISAGGTL